MNIDEITNGIVIDHITPGKGFKLFRLLNLESLDCAVAFIKNAHSDKMGRKDIIKIDSAFDLNLDLLGYFDPGATVNYIHEGQLVEKKQLSLPQTLKNVIRCKNPRCISLSEQELPQVFTLSDASKGEYRCLYCEAEAEI